MVGAVPDVDQQYNIYRANHFLLQRLVPTDVTLELTGEHMAGQTYRVAAKVGVEPDGTPKILRIYMVQVLDHWPDTPEYHRNGFKQAASSHDVIVAPGSFQTVEELFTFDAESWARQENIRLVAWAQAPATAAPADVYQAAVLFWPLVSFPGDQDGDGVADTSDNCPGCYNPEQLDADGDEVGDVCDNCDLLVNPDQANADEDPYGDSCDNCPVLHHFSPADADGDAVGDVCDSCAQIAAPGGVDQFGRALGTVDMDCDVDGFDVTLFKACSTGPGSAGPPPGCDAADFARCDLDSDGDVDMDDLPTLVLNLTGTVSGPALYTGASACAECHAERHAGWLGTVHSTAFDTLVAGGNGTNPLCFPCHSVAYGSASGFVSLESTPHLAGVQCENCHGPGSAHAAEPEQVHLEVNFDSALCGACHQSCHGACGEDHHPQFEEWSTSGHSMALIDLWLAPDANDSCLACHSTDYRLAPPGQEPGLFDATNNIECVACHSPYSTGNRAQLRRAPSTLCSECHTMGDVVPGAEPHWPQTEMLHGDGGFRLDGTTLDGPYSAHWWGIPDECVVCHVYKQSYGGPGQPVISGHTFASDLRACQPCHTETAAGLLVEAAREEINARLAEIGRYLDPSNENYVDPATLTPEEFAQYEIAIFNYRFVRADRSYGTHNAFYARAALAETESFFGITPWRMSGCEGQASAGKGPAADQNPGEVSR